MQKLIAILQIKSFNYADFLMWLKWYNDFIKCDDIYVCDDESSYDLKKLINFVNPNIHFIKMSSLDISNENKSFNKQQKNVNAILKIAKPEKDDIIILPDNDEFWWYDETKFSSFKDCVNDYRKKLGNVDAIYVPWTLMRSKEPMIHREKTQNYAECFKYRCNVSGCEHKSIMFYKGPIEISFHCGYVNGKTITAPTNLYYHSKCVYDLPLRCYHFRFTTVEEFAFKRSCEISVKDKPRPYLKNDFLHQVFNGEDQNDKYEIEDLTVFNTYNKL